MKTLAPTSEISLLRRKFDQAVVGDQESHHGGVKSQYNQPQNVVELHIEAGANRDGSLMEDFLLALYEARDTISAGQSRNPLVPGFLFMRPGGAKVLKMTMEMLGEALGAGGDLDAARRLKGQRQSNPAPPSPAIDDDHREDILDPDFVAEHLHYRESLVGQPGVTMKPIGGGTGGGTVDMLDNNAAGSPNERLLYDNAVIALRPFLSIAVTVELAQLKKIISMMESRASWKKFAIRVKYLKESIL